MSYSVVPIDMSGNVGNAYTGTLTKDTLVPTLREVTPVLSLTNDSSPSITVSSSELADPTFSGACTSSFGQLGAGNNAMSLDTLRDGPYDSCYLIVTDSAGNESTPLLFSSFTVDTTPPAV